MRFPDDLAGEFVETDEGCAVGAPDFGDDMIAIHDGRGVVAVASRALRIAFFADEDRPEILDVVGVPALFTVSQRQTFQFAAAGLGVDAIAVDQGRAAWAGFALAVFMHIVQWHAPEDLAMGGVVGVDDFFILLVVETDDFTGGDDGGRNAIAEGYVPNDMRRGGDGFGCWFVGGEVAGAIGAAPLEPVAGVGGGAEGKDGSDEDEKSVHGVRIH